MRRAWLVTVVACADPGAGPSAVTPFVDIDTTHITMQPSDPGGVEYKLEFPTDGVRLPEGIDLPQGNLLQGKTDLCTQLESGMGVGATDVFRAAAGDFDPGNPNTNGSGDVSVELAGPAVGQIRVEWHAPYTCGGAHVANGVTTFTAFPSGRIVRNDESVAPTDTDVTSNTDCQCGGFGAANVESFYHFAPGSDVDATDTPIPAATQAQQGCTLYTGQPDAPVNVGIAWSGADAHQAGNSTWLYFLAQGQNTLAAADNFHIVSALQLSTETTCGAILPKLADVHLTIDGNDVGTNNDGLFDDTAPHPAAFDVTPVNDTLPGGFAIKIAIGDHADITRDPAVDGQFFIAQEIPDDPSRILLWFRDDLGVGARIHIEPR